MPTTITLDRAGCAIGATSDRAIMRALAHSIIKITATGPLTPKIVNNAGGLVSNIANFPVPNFVSGPDGTPDDRASATDVGSALTAMQNALKTIYGRANAAASAIGLAAVPYGGGGTDGAGAVAAIPTTVSASPTGPQDIESNAVVAAYNDAIYNLAILVNRIAEATGDSKLRIILGSPSTNASTSYPTPGSPSPNGAPNLLKTGIVNPLPTSFAVAPASPGVSAAAWAAVLVVYANILTSIASVLATALLPGTIRVIPVQ